MKVIVELTQKEFVDHQVQYNLVDFVEKTLRGELRNVLDFKEDYAAVSKISTIVRII